MVVVVHPADLYGCGYYRLLFAAKVLLDHGHDIRIVPPKARHGIKGITDRHGNIIDLQIPADADVMVFQRLTYRQIADALPLIRRRGVAVVVDMDDDLDRIDPRNPAFWALHPKSDTKHDTVSAATACANATLVTVSTPQLLKRYAPAGNGVVIPNCVPQEFLRIPRADSPVIGWAGSLHSHPADLSVMGDSVGRLMREDHQFRVVGPVDGIRDALGLPWEPDATGPLPIDRWALGVSTLGVGMAPLADTIFNVAKSRLKMIEYFSLGVPCVFSPRDDYLRLHRDSGAGLPAAKPKDWYRHLKRLITDDSWRREQSDTVRAAAAAYTVEANAWRWWEAWTEALRRQRRTTAAFSRHVTPHAAHT